MADRLDAAQGFELLLGPLSVGAGSLEVAINELDGLEQSAGGFALPYFAKAAAANALDELVTRDRLCSAFEPYRHGHGPVKSKKYILTHIGRNANYSLPSGLPHGNWDVLGVVRGFHRIGK